MKFDPAADGPEVKLIAFFSMYPEGSFCRRVSDIDEDEMKMLYSILSRKLRFKGRIPDGPFGTFSSKRTVSAASRRKPNARRTTHNSRLSN